MNDIALFTDVSLNPGLKLGVGAYIAFPAPLLIEGIERSEVLSRLKIRRFEDTSSTKLEIQTVLWALKEYRNGSKIAGHGKLCLYTDSQCVSGLLKRRPALLARGFLSRKTSRPLRNAPLYHAFYELHDELGFQVIKVKGHSKGGPQDSAHRIFSFLDNEVRKTFRLWMGEFLAAPRRSVDNVLHENWCVYVLKCSNNAFYIGLTNNIERRLKEHELGRGSKFVRSWRPFELVKTVSCKNAGEARSLEYHLKKLTRNKKIEALDLGIRTIK
ncbi:MAG: GIY-YIG nuclease family protein [Thermodesulfovibrionales bacterium]|jgi:predicted GIY-YIG superfamily endonuclease/ribonuclease HI